MDDFGGAGDLLAGDIQMRDRADALWTVGVHPYAFVAKSRSERGGGAEFQIDFEDHDVSIDDLRVEFQAGSDANRLGEEAGIRMIFGEAVDVVIERIAARRRR